MRPWLTHVHEKIAWGFAGVLALAFVAILAGVIEAGPLDPPGAPAPTDGVRLPGTPISSYGVNLTAPGHYYLTRDLVGGGTGILITGDDVDVDLNGFALRGTPGAGIAISIQAGRTRARIHDGSISGLTTGIHQAADGALTQITVENVMFSGQSVSAIAVQERATITDCTVLSTGGAGVVTGFGSLIERCTVTESTGFGINAGENSVVQSCILRRIRAAGAGDAALKVGDGSVIESCVLFSNAMAGIVAGNGAVVRDSNVAFSTAAGITVGAGSTIDGSASRGNTGNGIETGNYGTVENCTAANNGGSGITVSARSVVRGCNAFSNAVDGIVAVSGSLIESSVAAFNNNDGIDAGTGNHVVNNTATDNGDAPGGGTADGAGIHLTSTANMVEGNVLEGNDIGIQSDSGNSTVVRNAARLNPGGNYLLAADDLDGVSITSANDSTDTNAHYNYAP